MNFIKLICAASICLILNGCNPAFVTGMAKGFTEQLERRSIQKNSERQVYGMTKDKAKAEFENMYETMKTCHNRTKNNFLIKYPEYEWFTKEIKDFTARDYADNTKVSGDREKEALISYNEIEMNCFNRSLGYISSNNIFAQELILPMQILSTESLISTAKYVNGEITRGKMMQITMKLHNEFRDQAKMVAQNIRDRAYKIQKENVMLNLQRENNRISRELANRPIESIKRYRPIFCHQYYAINTISCY